LEPYTSYYGVSTQLNATTSFFLNSTRLDLTRVDLIQTDSTIHHKFNLTMLWNERMGNIGEKGLQYMHNKDMVNIFLNVIYKLTFVNILYMENKFD
jgi:hypothetical protein